MKLTVKSRSGREIFPGGIELDDEATVDDLQKAIHAKNKKWFPGRQRLTLPPPDNRARPIVLEAGKNLSSYVLPGGHANIIFKDLGPQIGWRTVYFWEYVGPLLIFPLFYVFKDNLYPWYTGPRVTHRAQTAALVYFSFHYVKRILETFFIHRFSKATMPLFNLFKNCGYYWGFGAFIAYFVNHPLYTPVGETQMICGFAFAVVCQLSNLYTHIILKGLRPADGAGGYQIPRGFLFNYITCANYTTEIGGWLGFNIATQTLAGYVFLLAGTYQMALWALARHKRLVKLFDGKDGRPKYPRRWVMLPPFF
eukprot:TRINITY_DN2272_c0_g1_i2.p1 TRINITY_DN2272_c0_g1~~TRINITY_DN2272_c0_g1_i2.p1  ORF type:complete len:309 (-),score=52.90 TRINITY_DN2272_c0_g1_i2:118-1044(-)